MSSSATHTPPAAGRWVPPYTEGMAPRGRIPSEVDVVVIGAGFAGASVAAALTRAGGTSGLVLERELLPGSHASGRNAAMAGQVETNTSPRTLPNAVLR